MPEPISPSKRRRDADVEAVIDLLATAFPKAFSVYEARRRPLRIGIRDDLVKALGGAVTEIELQTALRCYTANRVYRSRLRVGAVRYDLHGTPCGVVAAGHAVGDIERKARAAEQSNGKPVRTPAGERRQQKTASPPTSANRTGRFRELVAVPRKNLG